MAYETRTGVLKNEFVVESIYLGTFYWEYSYLYLSELGDNLPSISREFAKDVLRISQNFAEIFFLDFHRNGFLLVDANFLKHFFLFW